MKKDSTIIIIFCVYDMRQAVIKSRATKASYNNRNEQYVLFRFTRLCIGRYEIRNVSNCTMTLTLRFKNSTI